MVAAASFLSEVSFVATTPKMDLDNRKQSCPYHKGLILCSCSNCCHGCDTMDLHHAALEVNTVDHRDDSVVIVMAAVDHQRLADRASVDETGTPLDVAQNKQFVIRSVGDCDDIVVLPVDTVSTNDDHRDSAMCAVVVVGGATGSAPTA